MNELGISNLNVAVIGGSTGSVRILFDLIPSLPKFYPLAIIVVIHRKTTDKDLLVDVLKPASQILVKEVECNEKIKPGVVYIAPANYHLLIEEDESIVLDYSEKVNFSRPSIDVTMTSAAYIFKTRLIGILLTGANSDGSVGMSIIKSQGGFTIIEDPATAEVKFMPEAAMVFSKMDLILSAEGIKEYLINLSKNIRLIQIT